MRYLLTTAIILLNSLNSNSQQLPTDSTYNKWIHAVINIESHFINTKMVNQIINGKKFGTITTDSLNNSPTKKSGTAIFLEYKNEYYLLTARHVLCDTAFLDSNEVAGKILLIENDSILNGNKVLLGTNIINQDPFESISLMNLSSGGPFARRRKFCLSTIDNDIGIIKLSKNLGQGEEFAATLLKRGYRPITLKDIDTVFIAKRYKDVFAIGYPINSHIFNKNWGPILLNWEASFISVPVISKGVFLNEFPVGSNFFDAMIFIYSGFSGGPIFANNKLIGIVSAVQYSEGFSTGNKVPFKYFILNHSKFIKSSLILPLLKELESHK